MSIKTITLPPEILERSGDLDPDTWQVVLSIATAYVWPGWGRPLGLADLIQITGLDESNIRRGVNAGLDSNLLTKRLTTLGLAFDLSDVYLEYRKGNEKNQSKNIEELKKIYAEQRVKNGEKEMPAYILGRHDGR